MEKLYAIKFQGKPVNIVPLINSIIPKINEKSFVVICDVGAYWISLASNYNIRPKPIEILIKNSKIQVIKKRRPNLSSKIN